MPDVTDRVAAASTTLLCGPSLGSDTRGCCTDFLEAGAGEDREVLWVTYTRPPGTCVEALPDSVPARGVIAVGDAPRWDPSIDDVPVEVIAKPADVTALGVELSHFCSTADGDLVVCFDSVTAMCQYVDPETVYGFVHTVVARLHAAGARAHFHLDPAAHDPSTVDLFASLCDAVVELDGDEPRVRTRPAVE